MCSTEGTATLGKEALSFEIAFADGTLEAIGVVVLVQRFHPPVTGGNGKSAADALGGEEIIPVLLAVGKAILQVERAVSKWFLAVRTRKTNWMPLLVEGVQTVLWKGKGSFKMSRKN